jgi:hypothetical protein
MCAGVLDLDSDFFAITVYSYLAARGVGLGVPLRNEGSEVHLGIIFVVLIRECICELFLGRL